MKHPQIDVPKQAMITPVLIVFSVLVGMAIASHGSVPPKRNAVNFKSAGASQHSSPAPAVQSTRHGSAPQVAADSTTAPLISSKSSGSSGAAPVSESQPSAPAPQPTSHIAAVIAVNAIITDWSDPQPTDSKFGLGCRDSSGSCTPIAWPTVVQYRYCIWTYSDDSTRQRIYATQYSTVDGATGSVTGSAFIEPTYDCTVANAP